MRLAGLIALAAFLGCSTAEVQSKATCYTNGPELEHASDLGNTLAGPVVELCNTALDHKEHNTIAHEVGGYTFSIVREGSLQDVNACKSAFWAIASDCISNGNIQGGELTDENNIIYRITSLEEDATSQSPQKRKAKIPAKPKPKPQPQPKPKPQKPTPQPVTSPPKNTAKSSSKVLSKTSSAPAPLKTKDCKQLYAELLAEAKRTSLAKQKRTSEARRDGFVGSRVQVEKRDSPKTGTTCGTLKFDALNYPDSSDMAKISSKPKYYGYTQPGVCNNFGFDGSVSPAGGDAKAYHIEHILEWQVVTGFFDWIGKKKVTGTTFDDPDTGGRGGKKMGFCSYFKAQWAGSFIQKFSVDGAKGVERLPLDHLKEAYPANGAGHHQDEFVWLHFTVNGVKEDMFSSKATDRIFDDKKMKGYILGAQIGRKPKGQPPKRTAPEIDDAKKALLKLKYAMGVRKYMRNTAIAGYFAEQKKRMGTMLGKVDTELVKHPRVDANAPNRFKAWQKQGLEQWWGEYMTEVFNTAQSRLDNDMNTYLPLFKQEWLSQTTGQSKEVLDLQRDIRDVTAAWEAEKKIAWTAPW